MAGRNRSPKLRSNHHRLDDSVSIHPRRSLTPAEVRIYEDRIAARSQEIKNILLDNQRLAASHVTLKQDVAAAQQDLRRLSATASSVKAERDAQVREVYERSLKLETEARSMEGLSAELDRVRAGITEIRDERKELSDKLEHIKGDIAKAQPELQEFTDLKSEIEALQREIRRGRAAIDYERKMSSKNFELSEAMEKHKVSIALEAEKLRSELANAERTPMATGVNPVLAANQGHGYAIHQPGYAIRQPGYPIYQPEYGGNLVSNPHPVHPVAASVANQGPGYAIHQLGYGENLLSDPHGIHKVALSVSEQGPGYPNQQTGYGENSSSDHPVVNQAALSVAKQGPGYANHQPGYGENSLSEPHVVNQVALSMAKQGVFSGPGYTNHQPGYGENSLSDPHVVDRLALSVSKQGPGYANHQPGYGEKLLSDPHVVHQFALSVSKQGPGHVNLQPGYNGNSLFNPRFVVKTQILKAKGPNKKGKNGTVVKEKKKKCQKCKRKHRGECLSGLEACFKCKKPGHKSYECPLGKTKALEKEINAQELNPTQNEETQETDMIIDD